MSFCIIFSISLTITSICLDCCNCMPNQYFGNDAKDVMNLGIWARSNANNLKTLFKPVSETKSTAMNFPTRGLYYPDDMFFTNWAPSVPTTDCSKKQSLVTTPSGSILKCTSITRNYEKPKILQTTVIQKNSSRDQSSSLGSKKTTISQKNPSRDQNSSLDNKKTTISTTNSTFYRQKITRRHQMSTHTRLQKTTVNGQKFSDAVQMSTKVHLQNTSRRLQKTSHGFQKSTSFHKSTHGSKKSSAIHQKFVEKLNIAATTESFFDYYADNGEDKL
uniref:Uncharacterized protein n=1 Tax=Schizaphis graminum TaxID=13262 RepID=A0A2S2PNU9_SCHGA